MNFEKLLVDHSTIKKIVKVSIKRKVLQCQ